MPDSAEQASANPAAVPGRLGAASVEVTHRIPPVVKHGVSRVTWVDIEVSLGVLPFVPDVLRSVMPAMFSVR